MRTFQRWLLPFLVALFTTAGAAPDQTATGATAIPRYKLIQLSKDPIFSGAAINAKGQVAFTEYNNGNPRAKLFDGYTVRDLGTLGGPSASVAALNDLGQVTGSASVTADGRIFHAYRWSQSTGMTDLTSSMRANSQGADVNSKGQVAGTVNGSGQGLLSHGFFWSTQSGLLDIGQLDAYSRVSAMNDNGTIVGYGGRDSPQGVRAFRWTKAGGIQDIGTLPDEFTLASDVNNREHIVGATPFRNVPFPSYAHAFIWMPGEGFRDLGTGTGTRSTAARINENDMVIGQLINFGILYHGFVWTRDSGLLEIGVNRPDLQTFVSDLNNHNQVVGGFGPWAFIWTRATGVVDLNTRLVGAPPGLVLSGGQAISDQGLIVASSNQGLFLLVPVPAS